MSSLIRDFRFAARFLTRNPAFTLTAVLVLALGLGALCSIFTVVRAVLLSALPYPDADRLVLIRGVHRSGSELEEWPISYLDAVDLRRSQKLFADLLPRTESRSFNLDADEPEHLSGELVAAGYFRLLGVEPVLGRVFGPEADAAPGGLPVAVVSHDLWQRHFGGKPSAIGETLLLNDVPYEVLGVLPPGFRGLTDEAEVFLPLANASEMLAPYYLDQRRFRWLSLVGRLRDEVAPAAAQAELDALMAGLAEAYPESNRDIGVRLVPLAEAWFGALRAPLLGLLAGAALVLVLALANVANLLLARTTVRLPELGVKEALGASRRQLFRQLLAESWLLVVFAALCGLLLANLATGFLVRLSTLDLRSFIRLSTFDLQIVGSALGIAFLGGVAMTLLPALVSARGRLEERLHAASRKASGSRSQRRIQGLLVAAEIALALVLLSSAGLVAQSYRRWLATDLGFATDEVLTLRTDLKGERYAEDDAIWQLARGLFERLSALPGVASVALVGPHIPMEDWLGSYFTLEEKPDDGTDGVVLAVVHLVSPGYFETLGIPLLEGRDLRFSDDAAAPPVLVVSKSMARRFEGESAVGQRLLMGRERRDDLEGLTVVGVVGDVRHQGLVGEPRPGPDLYLPIFQHTPRMPPRLNLLVGPEDGLATAGLVSTLRRNVRELAPHLPVYDVATLGERLHRETAAQRFLVLIVVVLAVLAMVLAAVGVYGVVSCDVVARTREIAVRRVLGAGPGELLLLLARRGALLTGGGLVLGLGILLAARPLLGTMVHGFVFADPWPFAGSVLVLGGVVLAATYLPVRRAVRSSPARVLQEE